MVAGSIPARVTLLFLMKNYFYIILIFVSSFIISNNFDLELKQLNSPKKIIFIYNASDNLSSVMFDFIHKIISPNTYQCSLCKITYGNFKKYDEWESYLQSIPYEIEFLYRNNYKDYYKDIEVEEFPIALIQNEDSYQIILLKKDFDSCNDLKELIQIIEKNLELIY